MIRPHLPGSRPGTAQSALGEGEGRQASCDDAGILKPRCFSVSSGFYPSARPPARPEEALPGWDVSSICHLAQEDGWGGARGCQAPQLLLAPIPNCPEGCPLMSGMDGLGTAGMEVRAEAPGSSGVREEARREE